MKKKARLFAAVLALVLLCGVFAVTGAAKDLEPCYHCQSTGQFHCPNCDNKVQLVCDGCGGAGGSVCPGEAGKGKCVNGWYTCPSCHGDGLNRTGDGKIIAGSCGNCGGSGKLECWTCHGTGYNPCTRCGGTGKVECQNENCKASRNIDWKCHYCMGAGYLLTNFWPGENDGVQNRPVNGDKIWVNGKSTTYGSSGGGENSGGESGGQTSTDGPRETDYYDKYGANIPRDPQTGRDFIWNVDLGSGTWEIEGKTVTALRNGTPVSGVADLKYNENIRLSGLSGITRFAVRVYLSGADDFWADLQIAGEEVAVGRRVPEDSVVPFNVKLCIDFVEKDDPPVGPDDPEPPIDFPVPENRSTDFEIPLPEDPAHPVLASVSVKMDGMSGEEQAYYAGLEEKELARVLSNVSNIVASVEPGRSDEKTDALLQALAEKNGYGSLPEGRLFPLYFEGHQQVGFPVRVTVRLEKGMLPGGSDLFVYHVADDGSVQPLGKAEYGTYEDGSVEMISFYTDGFSTFFTAAKELDLAVRTEPGTDLPAADEDGSSVVPILAGAAAAVVLGALTVMTVILVKKRKGRA